MIVVVACFISFAFVVSALEQTSVTERNNVSSKIFEAAVSGFNSFVATVLGFTAGVMLSLISLLMYYAGKYQWERAPLKLTATVAAIMAVVGIFPIVLTGLRQPLSDAGVSIKWTIALLSLLIALRGIWELVAP